MASTYLPVISKLVEIGKNKNRLLPKEEADFELFGVDLKLETSFGLLTRGGLGNEAARGESGGGGRSVDIADAGVEETKIPDFRAFSGRLLARWSRFFARWSRFFAAWFNGRDTFDGAEFFSDGEGCFRRLINGAGDDGGGFIGSRLYCSADYCNHKALVSLASLNGGLYDLTGTGWSCAYLSSYNLKHVFGGSRHSLADFLGFSATVDATFASFGSKSKSKQGSHAQVDDGILHWWWGGKGLFRQGNPIYIQ